MSKGLLRSTRRRVTASGAALGVPIPIPIQLKAFPITIADPGGAVAFATAVIGDLPAGRVRLLAASARLTFTRADTDIIETFAGNFSIGTTPTADATLTGTDANLIPSTALQTGVAGVSSGNIGVSTATEAGGAVLNNDDGSLEVNLNVTIADASIGADSGVTVDGIVNLSIMMI